MPPPWELLPLIPGDNGITATANAIRQAVYFCIRNEPRIRQRAELIVMGLMAKDEVNEVQSIFDWVQKHYRFLRDPRGLEYVKSPEVIDKEISMFGVFQGDCDDVSGYLACLLMSIGYKVRLVVMSIPGKGGDFRHIYVKVLLPKRRQWLALEGTAPQKPMGWEAPSGRIREYDL